MWSDGEYIDRFVVEGDLIAECYTDAWAHNENIFDDVEGYINGTLKNTSRRIKSYKTQKAESQVK
ncbi:MAG: hypothetical protein UH851_02095 [Clostridia bacterium]|nr:hypothetical protein [Clostridia bacterium]